MTARDLLSAALPGSIEWFAEEQARLRAAGEASARAFHENRKKVRQAAQEGIDRAVTHADMVTPGWSQNALEFIRLHVSRNRGKRFTGYELVQASIAYGLDQPPSPKAWGSPIQRAARLGLLVKRGTVPDPNPDRHGSDVPLWEAA